MKVLLIEDDQQIVRMVQRLLQEYNIECDVASSLVDAHRAVDNPHTYNCIVIDGSLESEGDTLPLVRTLQDREFQGVMIGFSGDSTLNGKLHEGGCHYAIDKPDFMSVLRIIRSLA